MEDQASNQCKIKVALVRCDFLNEWEAKLWENMDPKLKVTAFCSQKNRNNLSGLHFDIKKLFSTTDSVLLKNLFKYVGGRYRQMFGLEKQLANYDIAHTFEIYNYFTGQAIAAKKYNKNLKVVVHFADNTFGRFEYNYWPGFKSPPVYWRNKINRIIKENVAGADLFLPITQYSAELLMDYGAPAHKIKVLNYGIVDSGGSDRLPIEIEDKFKSAEVYMMVNRITKSKGVYEVLYAWKMLQGLSKNTKRHLLIIGDGPERVNMVRLVISLNLNSTVTSVPYLKNTIIRALYKQAKCLILDSLPSSVWQEQFGFVLAEAILSNCPVITTYSGAIPEVVEDAGVLVSPGNPVEIRDALLRLDNPNFVATIQQNCERIKHKFSADQFRRRLFDIYVDVLSSHL